MTTSLILTSPTGGGGGLPRSARTALVQINATLDPADQKIQVRFHAVGGAPQLRQKVFKISASSRVFAPGLDEGVGNLWRCFKTDEVLVVAYSVTPAFG
ncbi:hypothetical protein DV735_g5495, partial [Chaetothyriales sp. CBS 134920]